MRVKYQQEVCVCGGGVPLGFLFLLTMRRLRSDFVGQVGEKAVEEREKQKEPSAGDYEGSVSFPGGKELRGKRQADLEGLKETWRWLC